MRLCIFLIVLTGSFFSILNSCTGLHDDASENKIRNQVITVAEKYVMNQLAEPQKTGSETGIITISDIQKRYVIDPSKIFTGLIDDDQEEDAIVTVSAFQGEYQTVSEQLIILNTENSLTLVRALESDMRIISLKDRIITADVPEHSRNNPLFNCKSCWEVVRYQYRTGDLVKVE
jgi:hypothetical protein